MKSVENMLLTKSKKEKINIGGRKQDEIGNKTNKKCFKNRKKNYNGRLCVTQILANDDTLI